MRPSLTFWYEFASTYSWLAAERIAALAADAGVDLRWRPFLLGPIFAAQGWTGSPFNLYPAKGRNMWRDMERQCTALGLPPPLRPDLFRQNGLFAARVATALADADRPGFARAVYRAEFAEGKSIADRQVITAILRGSVARWDDALAAADAPDTKATLRIAGEQAAALGNYRAPSFVAASGELFWGNDRLEQAFAWARRE